MSLDRLIRYHERRVRAARSATEIFDHTLAAAGELGFNRLAIVHASWFIRPGRRLIFHHNFDEWGEIFVARRYYLHDPALLTSQRTNRPFTWNEMRRTLQPDPKQVRILDEAVRHGLRIGLTVPVSVPGEPAGCCTFATDASELPSPALCRAAAWIADEAFAEARRVNGYPVPIEVTDVPHINARRLECLRWAVIGRTDAQIALIMGLTLNTVRTYMRDLRRMFGVCSRTELARVAQRAGLIGLDDSISQ
ncbi:LuxR family transcriptional regulator [Sphingopyxis sp.]|uniref:helix-turn-helix transcriptional regulator n=1 Tax=Sphingopyxis sp. TaxID=1908224 RepID=UPI002610A474|nr:LuxR family transcriptional regulator [Sphingopyxis sp.]MCW0198844.1 LuxR family transcriptional regulator [Sphingopyxis sp.]